MSSPTSSAALKGVASPASLIMPIKSRLQVAELDAIIRVTTASSIRQADAVGTLHFARWINLHDHNQVAFFSEFDGDLRKYIQDFADFMGPNFDLLFKHVVNAPPRPVEKNVDAFYDWIVANNLNVIGFYSAYPTLTVQDIRASHGVMRGAVGKTGQAPLSLVLPVKSPGHLAAATQLIAQWLPEFCRAADAMATVHFARFVPLGTAALALVSEYDGGFDRHIQDLAAHLGPMFDQVLENVADPPPAPVQKNLPAFVDWVSAHNVKPWWFYSGHPALSVQDIRTGATEAA
jgi:hypothetical protein